MALAAVSRITSDTRAIRCDFMQFLVGWDKALRRSTIAIEKGVGRRKALSHPTQLPNLQSLRHRGTPRPGEREAHPESSAIRPEPPRSRTRPRRTRALPIL